MDKQKIVQIIENYAPLNLAEPWDCSGWVVETAKTDIQKVMLCLTVTPEVIKHALENECDMIISHHPLFYINCHCELVSESFIPNIDIYCAHTNLDRTCGGTTDELIKILGLEPYKVCDNELFSESVKFVRYVEYSTAVKDFAETLCKISGNLRIVNNKNVSEIKKIAFCAGSGSEFIQEAVENGADAFVTGDVKFHTAVETPIVLFDIGHFEGEIPVLGVFKRLLEDKVNIIFAEEKSPFKLWNLYSSSH